MKNSIINNEEMPITYIAKDNVWELCDFMTGEIFTLETERGARMLRAISIREDRFPWDFYTVRSNHRNDGDYYRFNCHCCGAPLNVEIDPYNLCMMCVDMGCGTDANSTT